MPTIKIRKRGDSATRYMAIARLRRQGMILPQENPTFAYYSAALRWAKPREVAPGDPAELTRLQIVTPTLAELIHWYIDIFETISR